MDTSLFLELKLSKVEKTIEIYVLFGVIVNVKLTPKLNKEIIDRAKIYAQDNNQSLSAIVEKYLEMIIEYSDTSEMEVSPTVQELSGIIKLDPDFDFKKEYDRHLLEKYK